MPGEETCRYRGTRRVRCEAGRARWTRQHRSLTHVCEGIAHHLSEERMTRAINAIRSLIRSDKGQTMVEYTMITGIISIALVLAFVLVGATGILTGVGSLSEEIGGSLAGIIIP